MFRILEEQSVLRTNLDLISLFLVALLQSEGSSATTPSLRSQKIAQAKWEFLFGGPTGESRCQKGSVRTSTASLFIFVLV